MPNAKRQDKRVNPGRCDGTPRLKGVINTITEGFIRGSSSSDKKWYFHTINSIHVGADQARRQLPPITFADQDFIEFDPKQNNPMVITVEVANLAIKKLGKHPIHIHLLTSINPEDKNMPIPRTIGGLLGRARKHPQWRPTARTSLDRSFDIKRPWHHHLHPSLGHEVPLLKWLSSDNQG
ncbi:hypothetical protein CR513_44865, partial [Mucuna pruriens]